MDELKYNNVIIGKDEEEKKYKPNELSSSSLEIFNYREALDIEIAKQRSQTGNNKSYPQIKKEIENRYKDQILAMGKIKSSMTEYENLSSAESTLKNLSYDLKECGAFDDKSIQRILHAATRTNFKNMEKEKGIIFDNIGNVKGLPTSSGLIKVPDIDEKTGMRDVAFQAFKLDNRTAGIDKDQLGYVCDFSIKSIDKRSREFIKESENGKKVIEYAHKNNIELEEAEAILAEEDKRQRLGKEYTNGLDDIETIKEFFEIRDIPKEIREEFTQEQIEKYTSEKTKAGMECKKYEQKFKEVSEKEKSIIDAKDILMKLSSIEPSVMNSKQKEKLRKKLEKFVKKQEKKQNKEKTQLDKMKGSKSLERYFENIDSYKEFVKSHKIIHARSFGTIHDLEDARDRGIVNENEDVIIGEGYDKEQIAQAKEFVITMMEAEVYSANAKGKNPMALPQPKQPTKRDKFMEANKVTEDQLLENTIQESTNEQENEKVNEDSER